MKKSATSDAHWRTLGITATGRGHLARGVLCQDHYTVASLTNGDLVVIVADGAGSAEFSDEGARVAVEECLSLIAEKVQQAALSRQDYHEIFMTVAERVSHFARSFQLAPRDCYTTLNVLHCTEHGTFNASIGDSGSIVLTADGELEILAEPFKGEYANETTFLTKRMIEKYFTYGSTHEGVTGFISATDGIFDMLFQRDQINSKSVTGLIECFKQQGLSKAKETIKSLLQTPTISSRTNDDLTMVIGHHPNTN